MSEQLRIGIIGLGGISAAHFRGFVTAGARVVAVADVNEAAVQARKLEWGIEKGYTDYRELLADPDVDAVSICAPNAVHHPATLAAARHGKHVLCEKPISLNLELAQEMIDACREAGVVFMVAHQLRSAGASLKARQLLQAGELGRVTFIRLRQAHDWGGASEVRESFGRRANSGGGTLLDNGVHLMDLAHYFGGNVKEVFARTATLKYDVEVEDIAVANLVFESGALGTIETSWTATGWEEGFWIYGTRGALEYTNRLGKPVLRFSYRESPGTSFDETDVALYDFAGEDTRTRHIRNFLETVRGLKPNICPGEAGMAAVRLALAAYESAALGMPVTLEEPAEPVAG